MVWSEKRWRREIKKSSIQTSSSRMFWGEKKKLWPGDVSNWKRNWKDVEVGSGEDGEACYCPCVITVPLTMVHFSEKGGLEEEVGTVAATGPRTDDVTSC